MEPHPSLDALESALADLEEDDIADAIQEIGFECTRCGACCRGDETDDHIATVFPDEARELTEATGEPWRDVVRPMPFGLDADGTGETIEWSLATDDCGDCRFLESTDDGTACSIYEHRPAICETYPFTLALSPEGEPLGDPVDRVGEVVAHECEGLGRSIDRADAEAMATALLRRARASIEEARQVKGHLDRPTPSAPTVVIDSDGPKDAAGQPLEFDESAQR